MGRKVNFEGDTRSVSFRIESEIADMLDRLPNKSDFIRKALMERLQVACPVCDGNGYVDEKYREQLIEILKSHPEFKYENSTERQTAPNFSSLLHFME